MNSQNNHKSIPFFIPFAATIFVLALMFHDLFPLIGSAPQKFTDIIIENVARNGSNKSGELLLFWMLLAAGLLMIPALCILFRFFGRKLPANLLTGRTLTGRTLTDRTLTDRTLTGRTLAGRTLAGRTLFGRISSTRDNSWYSETGRFYCLFFLIPAGIRLLVYGDISFPLLMLFLLSFVASFFSRDFGLSIPVLYLFTYYGIVGMASFLSLFTEKANKSSMFLYLSTLIVASFFLLISVIYCHVKPRSGKIAHVENSHGYITSTDFLYGILHKVILLLQFLTPALFSIYFVDSYLYQGNKIRAPYAPGYYIFFVACIVIALFFLFRHLLRTFSIADSLPLRSLISAPAVICLFIYNSYSAAPMYAQPDQHHHGEQMIPWQQIFTLGQSVYDDYTPVSGLFPLFNGGISHLLLKGTISDYSPAISITMVLICALTMYLVYLHTGGTWALITAVFFALPCYNRQYLVLPSLLLLMFPGLIRKRNLWLKVWILTCFIGGLYYPLFGAAVLIGTLPFGLVQLSSLIREPGFKKCLKKWNFYAGWIITFLPVVLSIPLLLKILNHTLTYSSQTVLADGIALFGQSVPDDFMSYLTSLQIRSLCYFSLRFLLPAIFVWIFAYLLYVFLFHKISGVTLLQKLQTPLFLGLSGGLGTLCMSYTYTLVRADSGMILSRTAHIGVALAGILIPVTLTAYGDSLKELLSRPCRVAIPAICLSLPLILFFHVSDLKNPDMWVYPNGDSQLILDDSAKIFSYYPVPDNFLKSEDTGLTSDEQAILGQGFMVNDQISYIVKYRNVIAKCSSVKKDMTYLGLDGQGFYYYNNVKACATGFIQAAKGYDAQQAILKVVKEKRPVIFLIEPQCSYYIYYWMHTHDYVYQAEDACYYPAELFAAIYPDRKPDDIREYCVPTDLTLVPDSFGQSIDTLLPLFTAEMPITKSEIQGEKTTTLTITPDKNFAGTDFDFLKLKLRNPLPETEVLHITFTCSDSFTVSGDAGSVAFAGGTVSCNAGSGDLLIPLGMNEGWLLSNISSFTITSSGSPLEIEDMSLLKLRQ